MSTNRLGRASELDRYWSESLLDDSSGRVSIKSQNVRHSRSLPGASNYPYEGQRILEGKFTYELPGRKDNTFTREADYEYRTASGLFLVSTSVDIVDVEKIISEVNNRVSGDAAISDSIQISREHMWNFLSRADDLEELRIRGDEGVYDAAELLRTLKTDSPQTRLDEIERERGEPVESLREAVARFDPAERVTSLQDLDIDLYTQSIVSANATFWYDSEPATLVYRRGRLRIDADNDDAREYLLQIFERDVIHPSYDE